MSKWLLPMRPRDSRPLNRMINSLETMHLLDPKKLEPDKVCVEIYIGEQPTSESRRLGAPRIRAIVFIVRKMF